jgi:tetratricopeptide (TPR) repeat protein
LTSLLAYPDLEKDVLAVMHHLHKQIPHPTWKGIEIIDNFIHNNPRGDDLYRELKQNHPFYCTVSCDIANYYMENGDYVHAEYYLTDALEIVDSRAKNKKFSIDEIETTIHDDYSYVIGLLEEVFKKSNPDEKKKKLLQQKKQTVENKSKLYSKSPKIEKIDKAMNEMFTKIELNNAEKSKALEYYRYLKKYDINFKTKEPITTKQTFLNVHPESYELLEDSKGKKHSDQKFHTKIGRNDPCYCGSGKNIKNVV